MKNKLPWLISVIVFIAVLTIGLLTFHADTGCEDIIGDGYAMGTDPEPVVIGQICGDPWQLATDASDFTTHAFLSVLIALPLGVVTWGIVWMACWKNICVLKKLGIALFMLALVVIVHVLIMVIADTLTGGAIDTSQTKGMITALLCLLVSATCSLVLTRAIFRRTSKTKNPKPTHQRPAKK